MAKFKERRANIRIPYSADACVYFGNKKLPCRISDVSLRGALIHPPLPAPSGTYIRLHMTLPGLDESVDVGAVIRRKHEGGTSCGVEFMEISERAEALLGTFVNTVLRGIALDKVVVHDVPQTATAQTACGSGGCQETVEISPEPREVDAEVPRREESKAKKSPGTKSRRHDASVPLPPARILRRAGPVLPMPPEIPPVRPEQTAKESQEWAPQAKPLPGQKKVTGMQKFLDSLDLRSLYSDALQEVSRNKSGRKRPGRK